ncbi:hypothetical protein [Bordetella petrii]|uniref:hypothetical protein n=1 Tax=Bordetella petrii TaxID=94624 RepID=UPI001E55940F|nr:hypothetical protein [Bordetella petrii]MCD0503776.1 hypothetical protein [Bordetella petrii]
MTTPARIAAFLSTSALCLGLASSPSYADQRDADNPREAHSLTRDREPARNDSAADAAAPDDTGAAASGGQPASAR